jgi:hypothetical protein
MAIYRLLLVGLPFILSHVLDISDSETPHKLIIALRNKNARKTRCLGIRQEIIAPASIGMYARKTAWEPLAFQAPEISDPSFFPV